MERDELKRAFTVESTVNLQAKNALAAGAAFEIWPANIPAARLHRTYARRLRKLREIDRPALGSDDALAGLAASAGQDLRVGYIDDRKKGGYYFQLFLSSDLTTVVGCIGLTALSRDGLDPDVMME